jgi:hypothetical protein
VLFKKTKYHLIGLTFWPNQLNDLSKQDKMDKALEIFGLEKS